MSYYDVLQLETDGVDSELRPEQRKMFESVGKRFGHIFKFVNAPFGYRAFVETGGKTVFPDETRRRVMEVSKQGGAIMKGPVGQGKKESAEMRRAGVHLENDSVIAIRQLLDASVAYRPINLPLEFADFSPLKPERLGQGVKMLMLRELLEDVYAGSKVRGAKTRWRYARDDCTYSAGNVRRFAKICFEEALARDAPLMMVHKPNVMATGELWEHVFAGMAKKYSRVKYDVGIVDAVDAALTIDPSRFKVVALPNLFGDILTDSALGVVGSLGLGAASCWNPINKTGLFEPTHGSAPDIAGKNIANPYSAIGSGALALEQRFEMKEEARAVWESLNAVFADGYRTSELLFKLDDAQKNQRVDRYVREYFPLHRKANPLITRAQLTGLARDHYESRDEQRVRRVVSTSKFGDLVADKIMRWKN